MVASEANWSRRVGAHKAAFCAPTKNESPIHSIYSYQLSLIFASMPNPIQVDIQMVASVPLALSVFGQTVSSRQKRLIVS